MHRRGYAKTIGLVTVLLVFVGLIWYTAWAPTVGWPVESRRVHHASGFSVVGPLDWELITASKTNASSNDFLRFVPKTSIGDPGYFMVTRIGPMVDSAALVQRGYTDATFRNAPAYQLSATYKVDHVLARSIVFKADGTWWDISVRRPDSESVFGGIWDKYIDSFRIETPRPVPPPTPIADMTASLSATTQPAAQPTTAP